MNLSGDFDYTEKHEKPWTEIHNEEFEKGDILLAHGIPFDLMENYIDNEVIKECDKHDFTFRYSVFLSACPKCLAKRGKKQ